MYFPFNPIINQTFTLYLDGLSSIPGSYQPIKSYISKNGVDAVPTTNAVTYDGSFLTLNLTATEMDGQTIIISFYETEYFGSYDPLYPTGFINSVIIYTVTAQPTTINTNLPNVSEFTSFDNPTMQEVLSVMWQSMTLEASKKKWSFATFLQKWTF